MATRGALTRTLTAYAAAAVAVALPWPLLLVLAWDEWGGPAVGLVAAARTAPYVLLSWAVGTLGDRVRRDTLVLVTLGLRLGLLLGVGVALLGDDLALAVVLATLAVACGTPAYPAVAAALPHVAGPHRVRATDALVTIEVAAWVVGPAVGGLLLLPTTRPWVLPVAAGLLVLALLLASGVPLPGPAVAERSHVTVRGTLRATTSSPGIRGALLVAALVNVVAAATAVILLPLSRDAWGQEDAGFGIATAWLGFGALGAPLLWWVRGPAVERRRWALLVLGVATAWIAVSPAAALALPALALAGAVAVVVESAVTQTLQTSVPDRHRAGALGLGDSVMVLGALVGSLLGPALVSVAGPRSTLLLGAAACVAGAVVGRRPVAGPTVVLPPQRAVPVPSTKGAGTPSRSSSSVGTTGLAG